MMRCQVGAVIGVGLAGKLRGTPGEVDLSVLKKIVIGWGAS
jgi:phosphate/sulfate permease